MLGNSIGVIGSFILCSGSGDYFFIVYGFYE